MQRIDSLDSLRALAVISVFFYHLLEVGKVSLPLLFSIGWIGVDLFFVLSGFFIGLAVLKPDVWRPLHFAGKRFKRIAPAYYVSILLIVAFTAGAYITSAGGLKHVALHLIFIHSWFLESHGSINGAYWTLGVEAFFYVLMMIFAPLFRRSTRSFAAVILLWFLVTYLWRGTVFFVGPDGGFLRFFWATQLPGMLDQFAAGIIVAFIYAKTNFLAGSSLAKKTVLFCSAAFVTVSALFYLTRHAGDYWHDFVSVVFWRTWIAFGFALSIASLISLSNGALQQLFRYTLLSYTGRISYSIYLYHIPVIASVTAAGKMAGLGTSASILTVVLATWLVAAVSYHLIESKWHKES
jgi:peptidoglycan/LPS O-acetylase OafA/YrhL